MVLIHKPLELAYIVLIKYHALVEITEVAREAFELKFTFGRDAGLLLLTLREVFLFSDHLFLMHCCQLFVLVANHANVDVMTLVLLTEFLGEFFSIDLIFFLGIDNSALRLAAY